MRTLHKDLFRHLKRTRRALLSVAGAGLLFIGCADNTEQPADGGPGNNDGGTDSASYVRIHYRVQSGGSAQAWGVHFWGAGSSSPEWGKPQAFTQTDDFGAYTDVKITATADTLDAWLGLIPVMCSGSDCKRDVETSVRFFDLQKDPKRGNVAECWITQGQAVKSTKPATSEPAYKISRAADFIDLGDGRVRLMFRVAPGSTGTVRYGAAEATLDKVVSWAATDDVNKNGVLITGLTPMSKTYYKISTALSGYVDESQVQSLTPIAFSAIDKAADWAAWGQRGLMYQLIVRTFADGGTPKGAMDPTKDTGIDPAQKDGVGDLIGLRNALPYLKDLGVDAIWMTPVFRAKSYHGYDTTDFYDVDPEVGTIKDFTDLTAAAHTQGIKIILDLVQNHVADVNPWFLAAIDPKSPMHAKYRDWFVWSDDYSNMYTDKHPWDAQAVIWACKNYSCYHQIFSTSMPELNFRNPAVRAEMKRIAEFWIGLGADGYRLDASKHIDQFDDNNGVSLSQHGTHVWWKEFNHYVKKGITRAPGAATVLLTGENRWDEPANAKNMVPYASDMDTQFDFPYRTVVASFLAGKTGAEADVVKYISELQTRAGVAADGGNSNHFFQRFLSNHDVDRPATQLMGAGALLDAQLKLAATLTLTVPGMPVVYYGEEVGKRGKRDKYLGTEPWEHDEFIREPMSWYRTLSFSGDKQSAWNIDFTKSNTDNAGLGLAFGVCKAANPMYPFIKFMGADDPASYAAQKDVPSSLFRYYKQLIAIRRANPVLADSDTQLKVITDSADLYEFTASKAGKTLSIVLSRKASAQAINRAMPGLDLISGTTSAMWNLPPYGALILQ